MSDTASIIFILLIFGAVMGVVFGIGRYVSVQAQMQRRLPVAGAGLGGRGESFGAQQSSRLQAFIAKNFDERRFGFHNTMRGKGRRDLLRARFFRSDALNIYIFARLALVVVLPLFASVLIQVFFSQAPLILKF